MENSAEDDIMRTRPFTVIENIYKEAGCVGFFALPTGEGKEGINMTITSLSVKNLDETKAENLIVGDIESELTFGSDETDEPIEDPTLNDSSSASNSTSNSTSTSEDNKATVLGCFSSLSGLCFTAIAPLMLGAFFLTKKKED